MTRMGGHRSIRQTNGSTTRRIAQLVCALVVLLVVSPAAAHVDEVAGLVVDHAWAEPATKGAFTKLRMRIFNESDRRYSLLRVVTPLASDSMIRVRLDGKKVG